MLIVVGFLAGLFFVCIQLLQKYGYVSSVNWDKLGNDTSTQVQQWVNNADITNLHGLFHTLQFLLVEGWGWGFWWGL
jgi:uncharacterized membrane protein (Fun14 family)